MRQIDVHQLSDDARFNGFHAGVLFWCALIIIFDGYDLAVAGIALPSIMKEMGVAISQVRASGGGARSDFWRQLQADIYKTPVVITNAAEGPAYGVALLAGVGTGVWKNVEEACKSSIKQVEKITPAKKSSAMYDRNYEVYRKLYFDLKERFREMAQLA